MKKVLLILACSSLLTHIAYSQEIWTLDRCIKYAIENSLSVKQAGLAEKDASINQIMARQGRFPTLDGNSSYNLSFGRQIDPTTNDFLNQSFGNQGFSISGGVTLYSGGRISNEIKSAELTKQATMLEREQAENDLALNVALAYIQILFAQENLGNAEKSLDLINSQIEQIDRLIDVGNRPQNARLDLVAQAAQSEQLVVTAQNNIDIAFLNLKQLLQLDESFPMQVEAPSLPLPSDYEAAAITTTEIYRQALGWQPSIRAGELRKQISETGVAIARSNFLPNLGIGGSIGSNWSSFGRTFDQIGSRLRTQQFFLNGEPFNVEFEEPVFEESKISYLDQMNQNLGYGFGLRLSIPIYNQGRSKSTLDLARLQVVRSDIANEQVKNQLKTNVQRAVADLKAAKKTFDAANRTAEARRAAYADTEKRFTLGVSNSFEFITAQNNRDRAEVDLLIAKYDYIFRSKVLDYYKGQRISLE